MRGFILSPWTGIGTHDDCIRPAVDDAFTLLGWHDVSGQNAAAGRINARPSPNIGVFEVQVTPAIAAQIIADPVWGPRILHHDGGTRELDNVPTGGERTGLRARLRADGFTVAQAIAVFDAIPVGATRRQIALALLVWLRNRPGI